MNSVKYILLVGFLFVGLISNPVYAYNCDNWVAKLQSTQGSVQVRQAVKNQTTKQWIKVNRNDTFCKGDVLRVQENSRAALLLRNETLLRLNQNTTITFTDLSPDKPSVVSVQTGFAHFVSRVKAAFEVITPFINAAIEGTEFVVAVNNGEAEVTVFEGTVRAYNQYGEVRLTANQTAQAKDGQAPILILKAKPRDAVNWSLYYPLIIAPNTDSFTKQASIKLSVGQVEAAKTLLQKAISNNANNSEALAMQAIISVVQNNKEQGLQLAQQAVAADENNTTAKLALSYAQQAHFNIEEALTTLQAATINADGTETVNALIWSRLAEVYLMHGELDEALTAAKKANKINPNIGRTHTVLGFAYLTRIEIKKAIETFNNAINIDQADPLSRLGLGLATIRQGNLEEGRREIEYAVTLDPNNALIRSYLGKAYYEEKRNKLAAVQFKMAKELDPNDPTAYFYNAIRMQSENMLGKALLEIQKALELNNQRAIYRSKLLLDQDQAVRNSNVAQIYSVLGFEETALHQASESIQKDFTNHSAHRLLSEAYAKKGRNNIARVSEIYQSILYSPLNTTPIPPHLSEANLGNVNNSGHTDAILNEYKTLFARNNINWHISGVVGNQQTIGDEIIYSALEDNFALSLGQYHFRTDGFRPNNDLKQDLVNMFFQWAINPKQSIQLEYNENKKENGDLRLKFEPTNYDASRRETDNKKSIRLGYLYKPASNFDFVASFTLLDQDKTRESTSSFNGTLNLVNGFDDHSNAHNSELQIVHKTNLSQTIFGIGNYVNNYNENSVLLLAFKSNGNTFADFSTLKNKPITYKTAYLYELLSLNNTLILFGMGNNDYDDHISNLHVNQVNPKFGIQLNSVHTKYSFAYFSSVQKSLLNTQTLEPTNILGFSQYYNDPAGAATDTLALSIHTKLNFNINTGIEFIKKDLAIPVLKGTQQIEEGQKEYISKAFINWLPTNNYSVNFSIEYLDQLRQFSTPVDVNAPLSLTTVKLPLTVAYNGNSRMSYQLTTTYYDQDVIQPISSSANNELHDSFVMVDTTISYKFSKRKGKISLIINNLFDQDFKYQDTTFRNALAQQPTIQHERGITLRSTFNF